MNGKKGCQYPPTQGYSWRRATSVLRFTTPNMSAVGAKTFHLVVKRLPADAVSRGSGRIFGNPSVLPLWKTGHSFIQRWSIGKRWATSEE